MSINDQESDQSSELFSYGVDWSNHAQSTSHCWLPYSCESASHLSRIQCATCLLIVDMNEKTVSCRSSFVENNLDKQDLHYWSEVSTLSEPCRHCQRKWSNIARNGRVCLWCWRYYHQQCWQTIKTNEEKNKCDYGKFSDIIVRPQWLHRVNCSSSNFRAQRLVDVETSERSSTPVIFFVNKCSGGRKGEQVYRTLVRLLNPRQVFLLENDASITHALSIYSSLSNMRICICGGDGTVAWVVHRLVEVFPSLTNPLICILPLGTGNDMSRALGWGSEFRSTRQLFETLTQIPRSLPVILDRWTVHIEPLETNKETTERHHQPKFIRRTNEYHHAIPNNRFFLNYISFGLDAAFVLDYHNRRLDDPTKFTSPLKNKILCINESRKYFNDFVFGMTWNLSSYMRLICDGQDLTNSIQHCHSLVLLNTRSFASGSHPWRDFERQDFGDKKIEVLGLSTKQMALLRFGCHGLPIAQCSQVRIELNHSMPVHMDGGPFCLAGSSAVNITHAGQVMMLATLK